MNYNKEQQRVVVSDQQLRNQSRQNNAKRHKKRRKKNYILYYIILIFLLTVTLITLSFTVLFNIQKVTISKNQIGLSQSIIEGTGVKIGDNLLRINTKSIQKKILERNILIDSVQVKRKFPSTLHIELDVAKTKLILKSNNQCYYFSEAGRLIKISNTNEEPGIMQFSGMILGEMKLGDYIKPTGENQYDTCKKIYDALKQSKVAKITDVSLKDPSCISLYYDKRIEIKVGNIQELTYKLNVAKEVIKKIGDTDKGIVDVQINGKAYFKPEVEIAIP